MISLRDRVMMLAMDRKNRLIVRSFKDAASICNTKEVAMTYGYLMGQEDAKKEASSKPSINEQVATVIEQCNDGEFDSEYAADLVFGLIYKWLDKVYEDEGYDPHAVDHEGTRWYLANAFQPFVKPGVIIQPFVKPGVISPSLPEKEEA